MKNEVISADARGIRERVRAAGFSEWLVESVAAFAESELAAEPVALEEVAREIIDVMVKSDFVVEVCGEKGMPISEIVAILSRSGAGEPKGAKQQ